MNYVDGVTSGIQAQLNGKAASSHTHNNYASTVTTSGSGNAVTAISQSGNTITATKGSTFSLSSHTHTGTYRKNLYNNASGTTGTVTLSDSAANYTWIEIFFKTNDGDYASVKVYSPNGKIATLIGGRGSNGTTYMKTKIITISTTSIASTNYSYFTIDTAGVADSSSTNSIYIVRVDGWN